MPTVLIVEDFEPLHEPFRDILAKHECRCVRTAEEGLELLLRRDFDVIIADFKLPGKSGAELLKLVSGIRPPVPVIIVSGGVMGLEERDFLEMGAYAYLQKPFSADELEEAVRGAVEARRLWAGGG